MSKHLFSLVGLCVLALAFPASRALADSAEDSDRQFLANLENGKTPSPAPAVAPASAPAMRATKPQLNSQEPIPKAIAVVKKAPEKTTTKRLATARVPQLPEVGDGELAVTPATTTTVTKVTVVKNDDSDRDHDHDRDHHFFHRLFGHLLSNHPEDW